MAQKHAVITEQMITDLKKRIGVEYHPHEPWFNTIASRDAIRHFAYGLGDENPLWLDEGYANKSKYGCLVAPPAFLYSVYWCSGRGGLPGIHGFHAGNDWEFFRPILVNDELSWSVTLIEVKERPSQYAGRIVIPLAEAIYTNQRGELIAKCKGWQIRAERGAAKEKGKYSGIAKASYTPEQLRAIDEDVYREEIRGAKPRFWEDVKVGDVLTPVVKGPLSMRDMIAFIIGAGSPYMRAHRFALDYQRRHPGVKMVDSATGMVDVPELVHMEDTRAGEIGIPGAYDYGMQRISWLTHLLTNWAGDDGFLRKLYAELRLFNVIGDTTWCKGKVTGKRIEGGEHLVDIECWGENQRGENTMPGRATVRLPSKG